MNRFMGILYFASSLALFSWLLGQPPHPSRDWINEPYGLAVQVISLIAAAYNAFMAIFPLRDQK